MRKLLLIITFLYAFPIITTAAPYQITLSNNTLIEFDDEGTTMQGPVGASFLTDLFYVEIMHGETSYSSTISNPAHNTYGSIFQRNNYFIIPEPIAGSPPVLGTPTAPIPSVAHYTVDISFGFTDDNNISQVFQTEVQTDNLDTEHILDALARDNTPFSFISYDNDTSELTINDDLTIIDYAVAVDSQSISEVPIPGAVWLFGTGLFGLFRLTQKKNSIL